MSFLAPKVDSPVTNRTTQARLSTYREAEPLPFGNGFFRVAPKWITDRFNDHWSNGSQTGQAFCSAAGLLVHGPIDYVRCIFRAGTCVALVDLQRSDNPADPNYWYGSFEFGGSDPQVGVMNKGRIYWGRENQPADAWLRTMTGQQHPPYRGQAYVVLERVHCGQIQAKSQARPALPQIEFSIVRLVSPTVPAGLRLPASLGANKFLGVNPVSALYDVLTHRRGGLGVTLLDDADWLAKAEGLETGTKKAGGVYGADTYIAPLHTGSSEAEQVAADYLSYFDGFIYTAGGKLRLDWFPNDGTVPEELPEISHHDQVQVLELRTDALAEAPTQVVVSCLQGFHSGDDLTEAAETAQVPFVRELTGGETRVKKIERPWFISRDIAAGYAQRYAASLTVPAQEGRFRVRQSRAVRLDGTPLRPGDLCRLNWPDLSLLLVVRITERTDRGPMAEIRWQRERGVSPLPYQPAVDPREAYVLPDPATPAADDWTIAEAPPGMRDRAVIPLVRRVQDTVSNALLHLDDDGDWGAGATELATLAFAARASLAADATAGASTIDVAGTDLDLSPVLGSGATGPEQLDDTLVAICGSEWLSIGSVTSIAADTYRLGVLRGRWATTAAAHSLGDHVWIARRAELAVLAHAIFTPLATRYFKIQLQHTLATGAMSAAKSVTFRSGAPGAPSGLSASSTVVQAIFLQWTNDDDTDIVATEIFESATTTQPASPAFSVSGNAFTRGGFAGGETRYYWARHRDSAGNVSTPVGPVSGTALSPSAGTEGPPGVHGSITHDNTLAWAKGANGGSWSPADNTTQITCQFIQGGVVLGTRTLLVTLNTTAGTLSTSGASGAGISEVVAGGGSPALAITFTHAATGATAGVIVMAIRGGDQGQGGVTGGLTHNNTLTWIKAPDGGAWAPNTSGTTLTATFYRDGAAIATRTLAVTFSAGALSATGDAGVDGIAAAVAGSGTAALTVTFTHSASGARVIAQLAATQGGSTGGTGSTGDRAVLIYRRLGSVPATPTGDNPAGWTESVPAGTDPLWVSAGRKTAAGALVGSWSAPVRMPGTATFFQDKDTVTTSILLAGDMCYDSTEANRVYRWSGSAWVDVQKVLQLADFGTGFRPVEVVGALPAAGQAGRMVYLTTDAKLYRDTGAAWTRAVDGADLVADSVTAGKIAAGQINSTHVGTNLLVANSANIGSLVVNDGHIANLSVGKLTAGTISGKEFVLANSGASAAALRSSAATAFATGAGLWAGVDGDGVAKLRVGDPTGTRLAYDGTNLEVIGGTVRVGSGVGILSIDPTSGLVYGYGQNNRLQLYTTDQTGTGGINAVNLSLFGTAAGAGVNVAGLGVFASSLLDTGASLILKRYNFTSGAHQRTANYTPSTVHLTTAGVASWYAKMVMPDLSGPYLEVSNDAGVVKLFSSQLLFGASAASFDVNLYRETADWLRTDDNFRVAGAVRADSGVQSYGPIRANISNTAVQGLKIEGGTTGSGGGVELEFAPAVGSSANWKVGAVGTGHAWGATMYFYHVGSGLRALQLMSDGAVRIGGALQKLDGTVLLSGVRGSAIPDPSADLGSLQGCCIAILNVLRNQLINT